MTMDSGEERRRPVDDRLDEALEETFPASDATATGAPTATEPAGRPMNRQAPEITREQIEHARRNDEHAQNDSIRRRG